MSCILIVDDNQRKLDAIAMVLTTEGHTVVKAGDGVEGLAQARATHPDLIIADLIMPKMNGYEFCQTLRQDPTLKEIPIVVNSVMDNDKVRTLAHDCDVHHFIPPAARKKEILDIIAAALEGRPDPPMLDVSTLEARLEDVLAELKALSAKLPPAS